MPHRLHSFALARLHSISRSNQSTNIGNICEALLYYDHVLIDTYELDRFADLAYWFHRHNCFDDFINLIRDGTLIPYHYDFIVAALSRGDSISGLGFVHAVDGNPPMSPRSSHDLGWLASSPRLKQMFGMGRTYKRLRSAVLECGKNVSHDGYELSLRNAEQDYFSPHRCSIYINHWLQREYRERNLVHPPHVDVGISENQIDNEQWRDVKWEVSPAAKCELDRHNIILPTPALILAEIGATTRFVWSARNEHADLYEDVELAGLCADKLIESFEHKTKSHAMIDAFKQKVAFPDVATLVNNSRLVASDILMLRPKSARFRSWLQTEGTLDHDAIIAYHAEVGAQSGLGSLGSKVLRIGRFIGEPVSGPVATAVTEVVVRNPVISIASGIVCTVATKYLLEVAHRLTSGWSPALFGNDLSNQIHQSLDKNRT